MNLIEVINAELVRLDNIFREDGEWTAEQHLEIIKPLHEALLILAKKEAAPPGLDRFVPKEKPEPKKLTVAEILAKARAERSETKKQLTMAEVLSRARAGR